MSVVYVTNHGAVLRRLGDALVVTCDEQELQRTPLEWVDSVVVTETVQVTSRALASLLRRGVAVAILSTRGEYLGAVAPPAGKHALLRARQHELFASPEAPILLARETVRAKLLNSAELLADRARSTARGRGPAVRAAGRLRKLADRVERPRDLSALRGLEGAAASRYWAVFGGLLRPDGPAFSKRRYHPAPDPVNAALSMGYALLTSRAQSAVESVGLDPGRGFFHQIDYGRPSLPLDLIEPLRAPLVDRMVLRAFNLRILEAAHFADDNGDVRMTPDGRRRFYTAWEDWVQRRGLQQLLIDEAYRLRRYVLGEDDRWVPLRDAVGEEE